MQRRITDQRTLQRWKKSGSYQEVVSFVSCLGASVAGRKISDPLEEPSCGLSCILAALDKMSSWVSEIPPIQQSMRYGNKAFKQWHARMSESTPLLMEQVLGHCQSEAVQSVPTAAAELAAYFSDGFGNASRIDYGTGHELAFVIWLLCLQQLGLYTHTERPLIVLRIFNRYLQLMRQLQTTYFLEPAGSHGVWGLDDYQFLPFLFGAAQLVEQDEYMPSCVHDEEMLEYGSPHFLYLAAVRFVKQVKKGPFSEHSPYLNDISALDSWQRVASGLLRMYEGEVLAKLPVVQHLQFGTLLKWDSHFAD
eukprot:CAMPEP_0119320668 /NCGR_PEP_ID=MMETSP1333-20130426/53073_1 /TAXON_ID=418940 /ORGANISM="Scyphosphaera apsteinii, Strain RCC1455" /LENGTH=306 /DNA_ID=CAMNT_0007327433 /DNA_START=17 /DNA_END=937 /DNA_ORIENTATION=+